MRGILFILLILLMMVQMQKDCQRPIYDAEEAVSVLVLVTALKIHVRA